MASHDPSDIVYAVTVKSAKDICKKITTFNAVCQQNETTIILSANPCLTLEHFTPITISIYNQGNQMFLFSKVEKNKEYYSLGNITVALEWDWNVNTININVMHKLHLMAKLYYVIKQSGKNISEKIFEVDFPFFNYQCTFDLHTHELLPPTICNKTLKVGQYAYACLISKELVSYEYQPKNGLYLIMFDSCTVPYSVTILVIYQNTKELFTKIFTQDKTDAPFSPSLEGCGLKFKMNDNYMDFYTTTLKFVCTNGTEVTLIECGFQTELSLNCPLTSCTNQDYTNICQDKWIFGENQQVSAFMNVTIDMCEDLPQVTLNMYVVSSKMYSYPFSQVLYANLDEYERSHSPPFYLGLPIDKKLSTNNGYLSLDGGNISLHFRESTNSIFVFILRHFPRPYDGIPLLRTDFELNRTKSCLCKTSKNKNSGSMEVALAVLVFITFLLFFFALIAFWRKRSRRKKLGLPHLIITEETPEEMDDQSM
ncbi:uncharacterized protein LOC100211997 isoform X1 [Hydra vulgaris]|uniref:uncharacterized protein LOC100211997 isoform X1 n=1 Tax=Hydra vulgaris TaxID=6087 RepID=UPI001F5F31A9|nr:uncharacterized protein LOC100211997 isoform X1 [Hydra vulgaris]